MFSLENFYVVMYNTLLSSPDIEGFYFYPFGSTDVKDLLTLRAVCGDVYTRRLPKVATLFYDQEPLGQDIANWQAKFKSQLEFAYDTPHTLKVLANSEKSNFKDQLCSDYHLADWYYFFHGFAALDWYRDYKYFKTQPFTKPFIVLNRSVTGDRSYRLTLVAMLLEKNLVDCGHVSLNLDNPTKSWQDEVNDPLTKLSLSEIDLIKTHIGKLPASLIVDRAQPSADCSAHVGPSELTLNQSALWHIVTETVFYQDKLHLTEKIFKPIVNRRPFILAGAPGNLEYLRSYGFKTFSKWIDESYDNEQDPQKRLSMITQQIEKICSLSNNQLDAMYKDMQEIVNYNFDYFFGEFKETIVSELVDNFDMVISKHLAPADNRLDVELTKRLLLS